jgi:hypothetical protein
MRVSWSSPKDEIVSTGPQPVSRRLGPFPRLRPPYRFLSYVNDADLGIMERCNRGGNLQIGERRVDRRTACLRQADAFREKALADPEHHDQWIDEAIKWLERAMEASCRAAIAVEADNGSHVPEPARTAIIENTAPHRRVIARQ